MKNPFNSRKFIIAIATIILYGVIMFAPDNVSAKVEKYAPYVTGVVVAALFGITFEDSVKLWAARPGTLRDAIQDLIDELLPAQPPTNTTVNVHGADTSSPDAVGRQVAAAMESLTKGGVG